MIGVLCLVSLLASHCTAQFWPQYAENYPEFPDPMYGYDTEPPAAPPMSMPGPQPPMSGPMPGPVPNGPMPFAPPQPQLMCMSFPFNGTCKTEAGLDGVQFFFDNSTSYGMIERDSKIYMLMGIEVSAKIKYTALAANQSVSDECKQVFPKWFCVSETALFAGLCFKNSTAGAMPCHSTCMDFATHCYNQPAEESERYCNSMAAPAGTDCFA